MNTDQVSIIIPTFNNLEFLKRTIRCLESQQPDPRQPEVIVVDDGSRDGTDTWIKQYEGLLSLSYIILKTNKGRGYARNRGVEKSSRELILFLDGDLEFENDFVQLHAKLHEVGKAIITIGTVKYRKITKNRAYARFLEGRGAVKLEKGETVPGRYFISGNACLPKAIFIEIGGFNEIDFDYGEDIDLGIRLFNAGYRIVFDSRLEVQHLHIRTLDKALQQWYNFGSQVLPILVRKYPDLRKELSLEALDKENTNLFLSRLFLAKPVFYLVYIFVYCMNDIYAPDILYKYLIFRSYLFGYLVGKK